MRSGNKISLYIIIASFFVSMIGTFSENDLFAARVGNEMLESEKPLPEWVVEYYESEEYSEDPVDLESF